MDKIKEKLPTLMDAVKAMFAGLHEAEASEKCSINMDTFGKEENGICFGCAATFTLVNSGLASIDKALDLATNYTCRIEEDDDLINFEHMIDDFRLGLVRPLLNFYGHSYIGAVEPWLLKNSNWKDWEGSIVKWVEELEKSV